MDALIPITNKAPQWIAVTNSPHIQNEIILLACQAFYGLPKKTLQKICTHACYYFFGFFLRSERTNLVTQTLAAKSVANEKPRLTDNCINGRLTRHVSLKARLGNKGQEGQEELWGGFEYHWQNGIETWNWIRQAAIPVRYTYTKKCVCVVKDIALLSLPAKHARWRKDLSVRWHPYCFQFCDNHYIDRSLKLQNPIKLQ